MPRPFVRVLGVALALGGCQKTPPPPEPLPGNPPVPDPAPRDPSALPSWDEVSSGHPEGATNPPYPVLLVTMEPSACYKEWHAGMLPPEPGIREAGGRVVAGPAQVPQGATQVQCPEGQPAELLSAWEQYLSGGEKR